MAHVALPCLLLSSVCRSWERCPALRTLKLVVCCCVRYYLRVLTRCPAQLQRLAARFQLSSVLQTASLARPAPEKPVHGSVTSVCDSLRALSCVRGRGTAGGKHGRSVKQAPTAAWWLLGLAQSKESQASYSYTPPHRRAAAASTRTPARTRNEINQSGTPRRANRSRAPHPT